MSNYSSEDIQNCAGMLKALSNANRLKIFLRLLACCPDGAACDISDPGSECVGELGKELDISASTVSHHIKELSRAGLILLQRKGKFVNCRVDSEALARLAAVLKPGSGCGEEEIMENETVKDSVIRTYSRIASSRQTGCCSSGCCGPASPSDAAIAVGYRPEDLEKIPVEASLGLGCGNPVKYAGLKAGETVIDLGSGAGMDVFLAASMVGPGGKALGVDMTEEMVVKAAATARSRGIENVAFFRGEIENLPFTGGIADVVISNCVINLSVDKVRVFKEIFRVLKPGGRISVSDIVSDGPMPQQARDNLALWAGCIVGALEYDRYLEIIKSAGFTGLQVTASGSYRFSGAPEPGMPEMKSINVVAMKPRS